MSRRPLAGGLYAITDGRLIPPAVLCERVEAAIHGGARVIQFRDKTTDVKTRRRQATELVQLCSTHAVPLIINDDAALAAETGASGVHLGKTDDSVTSARQRLGAEAIIGVSCYNSLARAIEAAAEGADYVAFGRFFPSRSKPDAVGAELELLCRARKELDVPVVAIGGITPENGPALIEAGAQLLAAIEGVFGQADVEAAARQYANLFSSTTPSP